MSKYVRMTKQGDICKSSVYSLDYQRYVCGNDIVETQNEGLVQQLIERLAELETKVENGTLIEINEVAKLFNRLLECPGGYIINNQDVCEVIGANTQKDWCDKNCNTEDYSKCWEHYIKVKLKKLKED